jgi:ribosomal protein S18 acetylase RimI-like enzyme
MQKLQTRLATVDDAASIAPLFDAYRQFYDQAPDATGALQFIHARLSRAESVILLAQEAGGDLVGFCQLYPSFCSVEAQPIYMLYDLFVRPDARRSGAGRTLLLEAEALSRRHGKVRMDLTTARTNTAAQSVYESLGWQRDDIFFAYSKRVSP